MKTFARSLLLFLALILQPFAAVAIRAQEESVKPGINESYQKAPVEQAVKRFETESREVFRQRAKIVDACRLKPGMAVADVGAGTGLFTRLLAPEVGPQGKVYAVDITKKFIEHIEQTCKEADIKNVQCVVCTDQSTELPPGSVDLVFVCDVYHHFEFPYKTLASIHRALRSKGQLILIDFKKEGGSDWVQGHVRANKKTVLKEVTNAGFKLTDEPDLMKTQYFLRFEKTE